MGSQSRFDHHRHFNASHGTLRQPRVAVRRALESGGSRRRMPARRRREGWRVGRVAGGGRVAFGHLFFGEGFTSLGWVFVLLGRIST